MPVLEGALERSLDLAAAMDSRGYGRTALVSGFRRLIAGAATLGGLLGVCVGVYGLLDASTPPLLGLPLLLVGVSAAAVGLVMGGQRSPRTTYRPDLWRLSEWLVAASGLAAVVAMSVASSVSPSALTPSTSPLEWPSLPWLPTLGLAAALLPALVAPAKALEDEALPFEHVLAESVSPGRAA